MENQIRLKWTSHQGTLLSVFDALLSTESLVDVTLACEGQYIRAHKMILSACSPYFQELINVDLNKHPIFFLKDVKYAELKALIHYMYRGEVNIAQEDLQSLLAVAQALKIRGLAEIEPTNDSISNDNIIIPDIVAKKRVPPPPPPTVVPVQPPPVAIPTVSSNVRAQHSMVSQNMNSCTMASIPTATVSTSGPPGAKKSRIETHFSSVQTAPVQIKQSQIVDDIDDVQSSPSIPTSQLLDPLRTTTLPITSSRHYESQAPGHGHGYSHSGHSQDVNYCHTGMVEDAGFYGSGQLKLEVTAPIEIDLEEEEDNSMSRSSFSESWRPGDGEGDNSGMADDDGEMAGGSGVGGAEDGEGGWVEVNLDEKRKWNCEVCGRTYSRRHHLLRHITHDCQNKSQYRCPMCNHSTKWKDNLIVHLKKHHNQT